MITVVIPAYNEEAAIATTVATVRETLTAASIEGFEIIVVDDGSADSTAELAADAGAKVIRHPHNGGYGRSLKDGITAASNDLIAITDADGTYPIDQIPALIAEVADNGFDMAVGARTGKEYRESVVKAPLRVILKFLVEFTAGRRIPDINSGLRVFRRSAILPYFSHLCDTFSFTTSATLAYMMTGKYIIYRDINYYARIGKTKVRLFRDAMVTLQYIVQAILYYNPIKLFIVLSGVIVAFSAISFLTSLIVGVAVGYYIGIGSMLVAMLVFSMGLLADLLKQIMAK